MAHKILLVAFLLIGIMVLASCGSGQSTPTPAAELPNPASVFCEKNGGKVDMRQDAAGGVAGICVFKDGSECDEWAYFRGECKPGESLKSKPPASPAAPQPARTPASASAGDG